MAAGFCFARNRYGPLSGAAKYPAGARPSKCIIIIIIITYLHLLLGVSERGFWIWWVLNANYV
jgi:hypothetical protein